MIEEYENEFQNQNIDFTKEETATNLVYTFKSNRDLVKANQILFDRKINYQVHGKVIEVRKEK